MPQPCITTGGGAVRAAVADFFSQVFAAGVYPADLNPGNILARRTAEGRFQMFLIDQVRVTRAAGLDLAQMALCLGLFYIQASFADCWGPWAAIKFLGTMIGRLDWPVARRRQLWRCTIQQAAIRQCKLRQRYFHQVEKSPPAPGTPILCHSITPRQLAQVIDAWRKSNPSPSGQWQRVSCDGRDWLVLATSDPSAAKAAWLRLMALWNLLVIAPQPAGWQVEGDLAIVVAQAVAGEPIGDALSQASEPVRRQISWHLARLFIRLRRAGADISAEAVGRLVILSNDGKISAVGFDSDEAVEFGTPARWGEWRSRLAEQGLVADDAFRRQLIADLRRASRLSRWMIV